MLHSLATIAANTAPTPAVSSLKRPLDLTPEVLPSPSEARGRVPVAVSNVNLPEYPPQKEQGADDRRGENAPATMTMS